MTKQKAAKVCPCEKSPGHVPGDPSICMCTCHDAKQPRPAPRKGKTVSVWLYVHRYAGSDIVRCVPGTMADAKRAQKSELYWFVPSTVGPLIRVEVPVREEKSK